MVVFFLVYLLLEFALRLWDALALPLLKLLCTTRLFSFFETLDDLFGLRRHRRFHSDPRPPTTRPP